MQSSLYFFTGILLLCWPTAWLCRSRVSLMPIENLISEPTLVMKWLAAVGSWNLPRAWLGVWLIHRAEVGFFGPAAADKTVIAYNGIVLIFALLLQIAFYRTRDSEVPAPVTYFAGVLLAVLPFSVALPAIILGVATCVAARSLAAGWASSGLTVAVLGALLAVSKLQLAKVGLLFAVPLVWVIGSNRHFVLPVPLSALPDRVMGASRLR